MGRAATRPGPTISALFNDEPSCWRAALVSVSRSRHNRLLNHHGPAELMSYLPLSNLQCPLCQQGLSQTEQSWRCPSGHSFDIARQGYVNLLPVQNKRSKDPGDSRDMVNARRDFLDTGVYQPLAAAINSKLMPLLTEGKTVSILDAGCGEGYYLNQLCHALLPRQPAIQACGLDISKWAVRACRARNPGLEGVVASNRQLPFSTSSQDIVLCNFGFPVFDEFKRVLKPGGLIVMLDAGPDHLIELRERLYPEVRRNPVSSLAAELNEQWQLVVDQQLNYSSPTIPQQQLQWLLAMTPHFYRSSQEARQSVQQITALTVTIDVQLRILKNFSQ